MLILGYNTIRVTQKIRYIKLHARNFIMYLNFRFCYAKICVIHVQMQWTIVIHPPQLTIETYIYK